MTYSVNWNSERYLKHIIDNKLDVIWASFCNPKSMSGGGGRGGGKGGIRTVAYTPLYPEDDNLAVFEIPCKRAGCGGKWVVPLEDRIRRVIYKVRCNGTVRATGERSEQGALAEVAPARQSAKGSACSGYKTILYRWVSRLDHTKLSFDSPKMVGVYGKKGRSFYASNLIYDKAIKSPKKYYVDESLVKGCTLTIDCDIGRGNICENKNKEMMGLTLDILREELDTFVGGSYNIRTSGNGIYIEIYHLLVTENIFETVAKFNGWIKYMNEVIKKKGVTGIKLDPINMPSRVFKMMGSIHQTLDLVSTPLEYDCKFDLVDSDQFKLKNWDIKKYADSDLKQLRYYDRYDEKDKNSLKNFLDEFTEKQLGSGTGYHKIKYNYKIPTEAITDEEQEQQRYDIGGDNVDIDKDIIAAHMYDEYVGWRQIDTVYGWGRFRSTESGYEMEFQMKEEDAIEKAYEVWENETKKKEKIKAAAEEKIKVA